MYSSNAEFISRQETIFRLQWLAMYNSASIVGLVLIAFMGPMLLHMVKTSDLLLVDQEKVQPIKYKNNELFVFTPLLARINCTGG